MLSGKNVLIGITGGIAAYKIHELIRMFKRNNAEVKIICTPNAMNFVTKITLQTLSKNKVAVEEFDIKNYNPEHISYADWADIMVIAPATANTISKLAYGICDNLLTSVACAFNKPKIIAPAMNCNMFENPLIQGNINKLKEVGYEVLEPEQGFLACGYLGNGRLCKIEKIFDSAVETLNAKTFLTGEKIVITAGGTIEEIDPVRYISNYSSGKMGMALADVAYSMGAEVVLISTVEMSKPYRVEKVKSALEMKTAVENEFGNSSCVIMAAAVADYRVKNISEQKIKKTDENVINLELIKNPDILKELSAKKSSQIVVGFCAESENLIENAKLKLLSKGCDYLIANDISRKDIGFSSDFNEVTIFDKNGNSNVLKRASKKHIAKEILGVIYEQKSNNCKNREFCTSLSC